MIDATLEVQIKHASGAEIADRDHILMWLCGDAIAPFEPHDDGFQFWACSHHVPDECECSELNSCYRLNIVSAG